MRMWNDQEELLLDHEHWIRIRIKIVSGLRKLVINAGGTTTYSDPPKSCLRKRDLTKSIIMEESVFKHDHRRILESAHNQS